MSFTREDTKVVKGMAIILMLYHHLFAFPNRIEDGITYISTFDFAGNTIAYHIGIFGKMCVALFMFLAGYGTYVASNNKNQNEFIVTKIKNLYITYWQVFFIFIPISFLLKVDRVVPDKMEFIWNFLGIDITYNGEWWFFTPYIILLVIFPIIKRFVDRKNSTCLVDLFLVMLINTFITLCIPKIMTFSVMTEVAETLIWKNLFTALKYLSIFMVGCILAKHDILSALKKKFVGNYCYTILSVIVIMVVFYMRYKLGGTYDYIYAPLLTIAFTVMFANKLGKPFRNILRHIGEKGTIIWLTHSFYCYLWCQEIIFMPKYSVLIFVWLLLISYATAILVEIFYKYLGRACNAVKSKLEYNETDI